ncbi:hypothetical protein D0Y65_055440 [Glycine soja]|uniref:Uncharacterized protein n=1 Tax=Glycine soja TaxID=3848 RepID=A0A445EXT8_GLYSO|nr:hypothetical protein D0Y65_055440 [Glycine soja]RZB41151.1 hypothetical protein D0Y65_055440 [Glycine soja]
MKFMKLGTRPDTFYSEQATRQLGPRLLGRTDDSGVKEFHRRDGFEVASADKMAKSCMVYFEMHLSLRKKIITKAFNGTIIVVEDDKGPERGMPSFNSELPNSNSWELEKRIDVIP